jgi:predicted membrane-bound spermidine synthase
VGRPFFFGAPTLLFFLLSSYMKRTTFLLEMTVFICGAVVMVFELVGSRVLGPYFGTSIFVWTSLIGVILGSLSFGYYFGGKMADKQPRYSSLSLVIFLAALSIGVTLLIKDTFLTFLQSSVVDIRMMAVIGSSVLFLPASVLLGMVSPYAVKLKLGSLETSGTTVGNLYALSTAGSIFGTFLSGFYLIPHFGTNKLLIILSLTLLLVSVSLSTKRSLIQKAPIFLLLVGFASMSNLNSFFLKSGVIDVDTAYNSFYL